MKRESLFDYDAGFDVSVAGRVLFARYWGTMTTQGLRDFFADYHQRVQALDVAPWAEIVDFRQVSLVAPEVFSVATALYSETFCVRHCATAYLFSRHTDPRLRLLLQRLEDPQSWGTSCCNFAGDFRPALNWVNGRLSLYGEGVQQVR
ncbi:hypothetical protein [Atopomonas hussainii]|nr:hypothetical protein [Atopomonas hussainii]